MGYYKNFHQAIVEKGPMLTGENDRAEIKAHQNFAQMNYPKQRWYRYPVVTDATCSECGELGYPMMWATGPYEPLVCKSCKENN